MPPTLASKGRNTSLDSSMSHESPMSQSQNTQDWPFNSTISSVSTEVGDSLRSVPEYDTSSQDENEEIAEDKRRPKVKKIWELDCEFNNHLEAVQYVKNEKIWSTATTNFLSDGKKVLYRCNKAKLRGLQCDSGLYLMYSYNSENVLVYKARNEHTCEKEDLKSNYGLQDQMKELVEQLFAEGFVTKKAIQTKLAALKKQVPDQNKLKNFIQKLRRKTFGATTISIGELELLLRDKTDIPEDDDEAFVVNYICSDVGEGDFKIFITTKNLLRNAIGAHILSADSTYKMVWEGFPISPIGTTDADCHFHLYGNLISKKEETSDYEFAFKSLKDIAARLFDYDMAPTVLISDASGAIHNGCRNVFGSQIRILMCYFHMKKALKKNLTRWFRTKREKDKVLSDVDALQLSQDPDIFQHATTLFLKKYETQPDFCIYFNTEWLVQNRNWYEGASPVDNFAPSTNNALESWNRLTKDEKSLRNRPPLRKFIIQMFQWTCEWSQEYTSGAKRFVKETTLTLEVWTNSYKWVRLNKPLKAQIDDNKMKFYQIPAAKVQKIDDWSSLSIWSSFDDFKTKSVQGWTTFIQDEHTWRRGRCNCPPFQKKYICKHLVGMAIRFKFVVPPLEAKALPLEQKRKRGRPSKAKKALIIG